MDHMRMESADLTDQNIEKLAALFPSVITETRDETGKLKHAINFELLKELLSGNIADGDEAYEFTWVGKKAAIAEAEKPIRKTLRPCKEESKDWDKTKNLYLEGDNLDVLKLLQESYLGAIKMIYIDPPYNTGRDFIYRDDFAQGVDEYEQAAGAFDGEENRLFQNTDTNGRFHSDWCSMMYARLHLAAKLLRDDGVIAISIDGNELSNLRKICDEVFGESNFINTVTVKSATTASFRSINVCPVNVTEFIVLYRKSNRLTLQSAYTAADYTEDYSHIIEHFDQDISQWNLRTLDDVVHQEAGAPTWQEYRKQTGADWKQIRFARKKELAFEHRHCVVSLNTMQKPSSQVQAVIDTSKQDKGTVYQIDRKDNSPIYVYNGRTLAFFGTKFKLVNGEMQPAEVLTNFWSDISYLSLGKEGDVPFSNGKKPIALMRRLCEIFTFDGDTVLDFFSGSASTAHAVLDLNRMSQEQRHFIMVQLPEDLDESLARTSDLSAKKSIRDTIQFLDGIGKPHLISEVGKERIRRVGEKLKAEGLDTGFRVLKLDSSNMKDIYYGAADYSQAMLDELTSNIKPDRNDMDLLYSCLLEWGLSLSLPHTSEEMGGVAVHTINGGDLMACFAEKISDDVITEIAMRHPRRVIFRDSSFASSPEKINVKEIFKLMSPKTSVKVL